MARSLVNTRDALMPYIISNIKTIYGWSNSDLFKPTILRFYKCLILD